MGEMNEMSQVSFLAKALFADGCVPEVFSPEEPAIMPMVADWQLAHPGPRHPCKWTNATWYRGLIALADMDPTGRYWTALKEIGESVNWKLQDNMYHADDHGVGYAFAECYRKFGDPRMLQSVKDRFDFIIEHRVDDPLDGVDQEKIRRWWWADALFMSPPALMKLYRITGDPTYLEFMNEEWWATTDLLYDRAEHLFYRDSRFFTMRETNGSKMFWSRGNGWVFSGLVQVLTDMPESYVHRPRYIQLFREMAERLASLLPEDGVWRASLLNPGAFPPPEASGSVFHTHGLIWGINNGVLDKATFLPVVQKAWNGVVGLVHPDGMLGNVQQIGGRPQPVTPEQTQEYGVGGFLLAASEIHKLSASLKR
jgi:unsaturated rhamnogalacturonyl hydrolase